MSFKHLVLTGALAALAGTSAIAQGGLAPKSSVSPAARADLMALPENPLTLEQNRALNRPHGPLPGIYRLRSLHSGNCVLAYEPNDGLDRQAKLVQWDCAALEASQSPQRFYELVMLPHPAGGYTIRTQLKLVGGRVAVAGQVSNCLTVAPGVIIGPARIEFRSCEVPNGMGWNHAGAENQRFNVLQMAPDAWAIQLAATEGESQECVAARGGSRESQSDFIKWGCNGNADQRFMLERVRDIPADLETASLAQARWFRFADGLHWLSPANGVDLLGASYSSFETIDDKGDYCMKRCAELGECKAWTWTGPRYAGQAKPMCHWKTDAGRPVNRGRGYYGKIYSGIVR